MSPTHSPKQTGPWILGLEDAPTDGTLFLAWAETPTFDEDLQRTVVVGEPVIAQVVFGEAISVPFHSMPQGRLFTHWQSITPPSKARPSNRGEA